MTRLMDVPGCKGCERDGGCAVQGLLDTVWGDTGERVTDQEVAGAMNKEGLMDVATCQGLQRVEELQTGVTGQVQRHLEALF